MKKLFLPIAAVSLGIFSAMNGARSQNLINSLILKSPIVRSDAATTKPADNDANTDLRLINPRALKDFSKEFKNATSVKWYKINDGFVAYCFINGIKSKVYYDKKSRCTGTILTYGEKDLPKDIRHLVKSNYYDFSIRLVQEIRVNNQVIYLVHLEDENSWKTVKVTEDDMTVIEELNKKP